MLARFVDAGELQRIDAGRGARDQPDASELDRAKRDRRRAARAIELAADRPPQRADGDEQQTRGIHIHRSDELQRKPREPSLREVPREQAVVQRERGKERRVEDQRAAAAGLFAPSENEQIPPRARHQRDAEDAAADPQPRTPRHVGATITACVIRVVLGLSSPASVSSRRTASGASASGSRSAAAAARRARSPSSTRRSSDAASPRRSPASRSTTSRRSRATTCGIPTTARIRSATRARRSSASSRRARRGRTRGCTSASRTPAS